MGGCSRYLFQCQQCCYVNPFITFTLFNLVSRLFAAEQIYRGSAAEKEQTKQADKNKMT